MTNNQNFGNHANKHQNLYNFFFLGKLVFVFIVLKFPE